MIAIAISLVFGIAALTALAAIMGAIARGYSQGRAILAELAQLDGYERAAATRAINKLRAPLVSARQLRRALA